MEFEAINNLFELSSLPAQISSTFQDKFLKTIENLERLYARNKKWVITYSGGKDSTVLVVLGLYMKTIHNDIKLSITYSDTLMEIPQMSAVAYDFLDSIKERFDAQVTIVKPAIQDRYWVRMLGRGYPPPGPRFRWCTPKIKIKPSRKLNRDDSLFITGMRLGESHQRDIRLRSSCLAGGANECGSDVWMEQNGIDVAAPIIEWSASDVWYFLMIPAMKVLPEVQLVVNLYGNTAMRFGCWLCTVVMRDKTMEALAKSGDITIAKLLEFREWIVTNSRVERNRYIRKDGRKGRMRVEFRKQILRKVKILQKEIGIRLITPQEEKAINELLKSKKYEEYT